MSSNDDLDIGGFVVAVVGIVAIGMVAIFATPFVLLLGAGFVAYKWWDLNPRWKEKQARKHTLELYDETLRLYQTVPTEWFLPEAVVPIAEELLKAEIGPTPIPPPPVTCNSIEGARYRDLLSKIGASTPDAVYRTQAAIHEVVLALPYEQDSPHTTTVRMRDFVHLPKAVNRVVMTVFEMVNQRDCFIQLQKKLTENYQATGRKPITPLEYKGDDIVEIYLGGTPLVDLFDIQVPFGIPEKQRMEHMHLCAGSGHGKTVSIQHFLMQDIEKVRNGEASVVVVDSQRDMVERIAHLEQVAALGDRFIYVNAEDVEHPCALNLFDCQLERLNTYSARDREQMINGIVEMLEYVLSTLSAEMTQKQTLVMRMLIRLLIEVEDATLFTLNEALKDDGYTKFLPYIQKLDPVTQEFFHTEFRDDKQYRETKAQIRRRLWGILENKTFASMMQHPRNKLDLYDALNRGSLIVVNTAKDVLKGDACSVLGKFIIALVAQAGQERAIIPTGERLPVFLFVDEVADYLTKSDKTVDTILTTLRKYGIGACFSHQYLQQLDVRLRDSMFANTSIHFAGGVSANDAAVLSKQLRTTPEFILDQQKGTFAVYIRNVTEKAVPLSIPFGEMEKAPRMSHDAYNTMIAANRKRYGAEPVVQGEGFTMREEPKPDDDPDNPSTDAG